MHTKLGLQRSNYEERKMLRWLKRVKEKRETVNINTGLQKIAPWLWLISEYSIDKDESKELQKILQCIPQNS
jgi:hypothetical protein